MTDFERCSTCHEYDWQSTHKCEPLWLVFHEAWAGDEACPVHAYDAQQAAEKHADIYDSKCGDYPVVSGSEITVTVEDTHTHERKTFVVTGQSVPEYHASLKDGK